MERETLPNHASRPANPALPCWSVVLRNLSSKCFYKVHSRFHVVDPEKHDACHPPQIWTINLYISKEATNVHRDTPGRLYRPAWPVQYYAGPGRLYTLLLTNNSWRKHFLLTVQQLQAVESESQAKCTHEASECIWASVHLCTCDMRERWHGRLLQCL